jgi:hypothetical protein
MKSPTSFIVKPFNAKRYDNTVSVGGVELITSNNQEDYTVTNRYAEVVSCPNNYDGPVNIGDLLIVHHNVFRVYFDMQGRGRNSRSFLDEGTFIIDDDQWFGYGSEDNWIAKEGFTFVRPVPVMSEVYKNIAVHEPLMGEVLFSSDNYSDGDIVSFVPDSEYVFKVNGETVYRIYNSAITIKWNTKKLEKE